MRLLTLIILSLTLLSSPAYAQIQFNHAPVGQDVEQSRTPNLFPKGTEPEAKAPFNAQMHSEKTDVLGYSCNQYFTLIPSYDETRYVEILRTKTPVYNIEVELQAGDQGWFYRFFGTEGSANIYGCTGKERIVNAISSYDGPPVVVNYQSISLGSINLN